uniref:ribosomal protein S1 n=1 Tax=Erythrolobus coxiae TaxID=362235 RepID=UPI001FCD633F|nr:ribosomal protein S1 [Erythrolobus coxiae]UNJ17787.1 ribosomal protein S1 [Erythrolobus coxiae]
MVDNQNANTLINLQYDSFVNLIEKYNYQFNFNDIVAGTVVSLEFYSVLVNIGSQQAAMVPQPEILGRQDDQFIQLEIKRHYEFLLLEQRVYTNYLLSMRLLNNSRAWKRIQTMQEENVFIEQKIKSYNKGGALTYIEGLLGFIPNSHLLDQKEEKFLTLKILEINQVSNRLTLSHKCAVLGKKMDEFFIGKKLIGRISSIKIYGMFIKVDNIVGLLHKSQVRKKNKHSLNEVFNIGDEIEVTIIHIDPQNGRISFSLT